MTDLQGSIFMRRDTDAFRVTVGRYAPTTRIERHRHEWPSICLALSGGYDEQLDRKTRRIETGTLVIHPEGEAHANDHAPTVTDLLTIEFKPAASALARQTSTVFAESWHCAAPSLLPSAYRLINEVPIATNLDIDDLVWWLLTEVSEQQFWFGHPPWLLAVRDYLEAEWAEGPSLTMLSEMAGVHPGHLTRAFRQAFRCSIGAFVQQRQAAVALKLLPRQDLGLAEISQAAGYADQSHMTRRVSALTGRPPGAWRRSVHSH